MSWQINEKNEGLKRSINSVTYDRRILWMRIEMRMVMRTEMFNFT